MFPTRMRDCHLEPLRDTPRSDPARTSVLLEVAGSCGERPNALPVALPRGLRQALPHRVRRVVAARASSEQVPRACIERSVLEAAGVAALHRALPSDVAITFGLRGSRAAQHVGALDSERVQLLLGKQRWHANGDGGALQDRDVAALDHGGERHVVLAGLVREALGEQLVRRVDLPLKTPRCARSGTALGLRAARRTRTPASPRSAPSRTCAPSVSEAARRPLSRSTGRAAASRP